MKILIIVFVFLFSISNTLAQEYKIGEEIELDGAIVTAKSCAEKVVKTLDLNYLLECPPNEGAISGYVIYDPSYNEYFYVKLGKIYLYQLEELYTTSLRRGDFSAVAKIVSFENRIPVIEIIEIYTLIPRPRWNRIFYKSPL